MSENVIGAENQQGSLSMLYRNDPSETTRQTPISDVRNQMSDFRFQMLDFRCQISEEFSDVRCLMSDIRFWVKI